MSSDSFMTKALETLRNRKGELTVILGANHLEKHIINFSKNHRLDLCITNCELFEQNSDSSNKQLPFTFVLDFNSPEDMSKLKPIFGKVAKLIFDSSTTKFWNKNLKLLLPLLCVGGKFYIQIMQGAYFIETIKKDQCFYDYNSRSNSIGPLISHSKNGVLKYESRNIALSENKYIFRYLDKDGIETTSLTDRFNLLRPDFFGNRLCFGKSFAAYHVLNPKLFIHKKMVIYQHDIDDLENMNRLIVSAVHLPLLLQNKTLPVHIKNLKKGLEKRVAKGQVSNKLIDKEGNVNFQFNVIFSKDPSLYPIKDTFMKVDHFMVITRKF